MWNKRRRQYYADEGDRRENEHRGRRWERLSYRRERANPAMRHVRSKQLVPRDHVPDR